MALTGQMSFGQDYRAAERYADQWAGDTQERAAVVEDFNLGGLILVMDYTAAAEYVASHDAEIQYDTDHTWQAGEPEYTCQDPTHRTCGCPKSRR